MMRLLSEEFGCNSAFHTPRQQKGSMCHLSDHTHWRQSNCPNDPRPPFPEAGQALKPTDQTRSSSDQGDPLTDEEGVTLIHIVYIP